MNGTASNGPTKRQEIDYAWHCHSRRQRRERHPKLSMELKSQLAGEQNWRCCDCGCPVGLTRHAEQAQPSAMRLATFQRVVSQADGGSDDQENIAISCNVCNEGQRVHLE